MQNQLQMIQNKSLQQQQIMIHSQTTTQQNKQTLNQQQSPKQYPLHEDIEQTILATSQSNDEIEFYQPPKHKQRNKYGNMLIICQSKHFLLSLGPNYLFFFFAYLCFTFATIYLVSLANVSLESLSFKIFNFVFCWGQNLSYLLVALSNPGVQLPQSQSENSIQSTKSSQSSHRYCPKCNAIQQRKTYHCRQCDVCIRDYDHHCPWTSKCIGGDNLYRFYFFVCMTPFYIFYYMVVFMICMANNAMGHNANIRSHANN